MAPYTPFDNNSTLCVMIVYMLFLVFTSIDFFLALKNLKKNSSTDAAFPGSETSPKRTENRKV